MCRYFTFKDGHLPFCEPLNRICTLCVIGDQNQYREIKLKEDKDVLHVLKSSIEVEYDE